MSCHGIPKILISDNGPPLGSKFFKHFCKIWGIAHQASSPAYQKVDGKAEYTVQTIKNLRNQRRKEMTSI
jgi:hypothetical protein